VPVERSENQHERSEKKVFFERYERQVSRERSEKKGSPGQSENRVSGEKEIRAEREDNPERSEDTSAAERSFRKGRPTDVSGTNVHRAYQGGRREDVHVVGRDVVALRRRAKRNLATARMNEERGVLRFNKAVVGRPTLGHAEHLLSGTHREGPCTLRRPAPSFCDNVFQRQPTPVQKGSATFRLNGWEELHGRRDLAMQRREVSLIAEGAGDLRTWVAHLQEHVRAQTTSNCRCLSNAS
jgi:hypothetical protein